MTGSTSARNANSRYSGAGSSDRGSKRVSTRTWNPSPANVAEEPPTKKVYKFRPLGEEVATLNAVEAVPTEKPVSKWRSKAPAKDDVASAPAKSWRPRSAT